MWLICSFSRLVVHLMNQIFQLWSRWPKLLLATQHFYQDQLIHAYQTVRTKRKRVFFFFFKSFPFFFWCTAAMIPKGRILSWRTVMQHCHLLHLTCLFIHWCRGLGVKTVIHISPSHASFSRLAQLKWQACMCVYPQVRLPAFLNL